VQSLLTSSPFAKKQSNLFFFFFFCIYRACVTWSLLITTGLFLTFIFSTYHLNISFTELSSIPKVYLTCSSFQGYSYHYSSRLLENSHVGFPVTYQWKYVSLYLLILINNKKYDYSTGTVLHHCVPKASCYTQHINACGKRIQEWMNICIKNVLAKHFSKPN
jgi:hypothetical protein